MSSQPSQPAPLSNTPTSPSPEAVLPPASPLHYVVLCGFCLGIIFLTQMQQGLFLGNLLGVMVGVLGLTSRLRIAPLMLVISIAGAQMYYQGQVNRLRQFGQLESPAVQAYELLLCVAILGYVAGHYRLQGIWLKLWPEDPRQRTGPPERPLFWGKVRPGVLQEKRPPEQISPLELVWFVFSLPAWALAGFILWGLLSQLGAMSGLRPSLVRLIWVAVCLGLVTFIIRKVLELWRHRDRDDASARLFLQDVLWNETRGEQRRINRWLVWWSKERGIRNKR